MDATYFLLFKTFSFPLCASSNIPIDLIIQKSLLDLSFLQCIVVSPDEGGAKRSEIMDTSTSTTTSMSTTSIITSFTSSMLHSTYHQRPALLSSFPLYQVCDDRQLPWSRVCNDPQQVKDLLTILTNPDFPTRHKKSIVGHTANNTPALTRWTLASWLEPSSLTSVQLREGSVAPEFVGPSDDLVHLVRF